MAVAVAVAIAVIVAVAAAVAVAGSEFMVWRLFWAYGLHGEGFWGLGFRVQGLALSLERNDADQSTLLVLHGLRCHSELGSSDHLLIGFFMVVGVCCCWTNRHCTLHHICRELDGGTSSCTFAGRADAVSQTPLNDDRSQ